MQLFSKIICRIFVLYKSLRYTLSLHFTQSFNHMKKVGIYTLTFGLRTEIKSHPNHPYFCITTRFVKSKVLSRDKILYNYVFRTETEMNAWIEKFEKEETDRMTAKQKRKDANKSVKASDFYKVGDIIVNSWGWEQTNVEFYVIEKVTDRTITIAELQKTHTSHVSDMAGYVVPIIGKLRVNGDCYTLRVNANGNLSNPEKFYYFHKWDNKPEYTSSYA